MVEFFAPEADMLIFSFWYLDKAYWENEVKESYSGMYRQVYADEERVLLCVFVTDVQYDPENREKKKEYEKLHDLRMECATAIISLMCRNGASLWARCRSLYSGRGCTYNRSRCCA